MARLRIGELLVEMGVLTPAQLQVALKQQQQQRFGYKLGDVLVALELCSPEMLMQALSRQTGLKLIELDEEQIDPEASRLVSLKLAKASQAVAVRFADPAHRQLVVAIAAPASIEALDAIRSATAKRVVPYLASEASILRALAAIYTAKPTVGPSLRRVLELDADEEEHLELDLEPVASMPHLRGYHADAEEPTEPLAARSEVMLYGWSAQVAERLVALLAGNGIVANPVTPGQTLGAEPRELVLSPLPAIERLLPMGRRLRGRLIVAGHDPVHDLERAQRVGANGFVLAPVDSAMLVRAIHKNQGHDQIAA
jgi:type IV pilus assembly protein PilB